ncbi:MAG: cytochrome c biogenesis protein CcsA [Myxococcota bacterium]
MIRLFLVAALLIYIARGIAPWSGGFRDRFSDGRLIWLGIAAHGIGLFGEILFEGMASTLHLALVGLSLLVLLGNQYLQRMPRMEALEGVLLPLSSLLLALGLIAPGQAIGSAPLSWWLPVHIGFMVLGFGGMAVAFSVSLLYLWVRTRLKKKQLAGIGRLPSLATLDDLNQRSLIFGFVALTAGAASGALWAALGEPDRAAISSDLTVYATVAVWLWYAIGLHLRMIAGYRGQTVAWFGVVGFAGISVIMAGATLAFQSFHGV